MNNLIFLDTETTDRIESARLVQLAYRVASNGEDFNEYFRPPVPISFGSMAVCHITNEMVADKPIFSGSAQQQKLIEYLKDHILVAHNAKFDMMILKNEGVVVNKYIDTLRVARHVINSEQYGLQYLRYSLGLKVEGRAHEAWVDVLALEALFKYLVAWVGERFSLTGDEEVITKMIELTNLPVLMESFTFGKYKGQTFKEIALFDKSYLQWLYNSETQKSVNEQNEELVYTLKNYLG